MNNDEQFSVASSIPEICAWWAIESIAGASYWQSYTAENLALHKAQWIAANPGVDTSVVAYTKAVKARSLPYHVEPHKKADEKAFALDKNGIAYMAIKGPMMKELALSSGGTSTVAMKRMAYNIGRDPDVKGVITKWDTPGGAVAGNADFAKALTALAAYKPMISFCEDLCASAGYWAAISAQQVIATPSTFVGSIGTVMVIPDMSRMAANLGVKPLVISTGKYKGAGTPGTEITPDHQAYFQSLINDMGADFFDVVSQARGINPGDLAQIADGRIFPADKAKQFGLIDDIGSFDDVISQMVSDQKPKSRRTRSQSAMAQQQNLGWRERAALVILGQDHAVLAADGDDDDANAGAPRIVQQIGISAIQRDILSACAALNLNDGRAVADMGTAAADGVNLRADLIAQVQHQATRAFGVEAAGTYTAKTLEHWPTATLIEKRDSWKALANTKYGVTEDGGPGRASSAADLPAVAPPPSAHGGAQPVGTGAADPTAVAVAAAREFAKAQNEREDRASGKK